MESPTSTGSYKPGVYIHYPASRVRGHGSSVPKKQGYLPHDGPGRLAIIRMEDTSMYTQIVRNWMNPNPITITPQTTLPKVRQLLQDHHLRHLPVVNEDKLVGVVTWRDIHRAEAWDGVDFGGYDLNSLLERLTAKEFMSYKPIAISPEATIGEAAYLMVEHKIGGLPVVEDDRLVGIITETDFCRLLLLQAENAA